ncbi:hypothetical protein SAMN05421753_1094 [Planctomicrobium piriforme]|uniref:Uncharacterized protein n=2 Tax=Planctomicrobium piriforme TaxID=1576369 RepID=A0A1I3I837_9PLAN|nr:hypothetical protein SAMN05421753_1094 [Planctomicrobium piriforme]
MAEYHDSFGDEQPQPKPGMSTTVKVLLGLSIGAALMCLVCCGGGIWFWSRAVSMTENPEEIKTLTQSIATIDVPEGFQPKFGVTMDIWIVMKMAAFQAGPHDTLVLMQMTIPGGLTEEQMKGSFDQQLKQNNQKHIDVIEREVRTFKIDGVDRSFEFIKGTDPETKAPVHEVRGLFPGPNGMIFLMLQEDGENWNEERAVKLIESISTK